MSSVNKRWRIEWREEFTGSAVASCCRLAAFILSMISFKSSANRLICESIFSANWYLKYITTNTVVKRVEKTSISIIELRVVAFSVVWHVVHFLLQTLFQGNEHLLKFTLLSTDEIQFRFQTHLVFLNSVDGIAQSHNLRNTKFIFKWWKISFCLFLFTFSPLETKSLSQAATEVAWFRNIFSCSSKSTDHLLMDSSNWRKVKAVLVVLIGVEEVLL